MTSLTHSVIDQAADAIFWTGPDGRFLYVNQATCNALEYSRQELLSMFIYNIDPNLPEEVWPAHWKALKERRAFTIESRYRTKEGKTFPVEVTVNYLEYEGREYYSAVVRDISMRRQVAEAAGEIVEHYRLLAENSTDMISRFTPQGIFLFTSPACRTLLGYEPGELIGQPLKEFLPSESWPTIEAASQAALNSTGILTTSYRVRRKDGSYTWFETTGRAVRHPETNTVQEIITVSRDVSVRKQVEEALRESEQRFRQVITSISHHVYMSELTREGQWLNRYVSPNVEGLTGYPQEKFLVDWRFWQTLIHPDDQALARAQVERFIQGQSGAVEYRLIQASGDVIWVRDSARVEKNPTRQSLVVYGVVNNVTEWKQAEESLTHEQALQLKSELLANISHDLRTPVNAILGYVDIMLQGMYGPLSEKQQHGLKRIVVNVDELFTFVENTLHQAQIESGDVNLHPDPFSPLDLIESVESVMKIMARAKGVTLNSTIAPDTPATLTGDLRWLRQILLNLISSALKFTEQGSIHLDLYQANADYWALQVTTAGPGLPPETRAYLLDDPLDASPDGQKRAIGPGPSIIKALTRMMGGHIRCERQKEGGSTIIVLLPLQPIQEKTVP